MSIFHTILDNNLAKLGEYFPDRDRDQLFNIFAIQTILGLDLDEVQGIVLDGSGDCGLDGMYVDKSKDNVEIHFFQSKHRQKPESKGLGKNDIEKTLHSIEDVFRGYLPRDASEKVRNRIDEAKELLSGNVISLPQVYIYFVTNGVLPDVNQRERAEYLEKKYSTFRVEFISVEGLFERLDNVKRRDVEISVKSKGTAYEHAFGEVKGLVTTLPARSLIEIYEKCGGERVLERNIRHFLGNNRVNKAIRGTAESKQDSKYFWCFNNGISIVCDYYAHSPDMSGGDILKLVNPTIVNGGQTTTVLADLYRNSLTFGDTINNIEVLARIYETRSDEIISKITEATNSQSPISLRDLKANHENQNIIKKYFEGRGLYLETKRGEYRTKNVSLSSIVHNESVLQAYVSMYFGIPFQAKSSKSFVFQQYFSKVFDENITADLPKELYRCVFILRYIRQAIRALRIAENNAFLVHAELALLYTFGVVDNDMKDVSKEITEEQLKETFEKSVAVLSRVVTKERGNLGDFYSDNKFFKSSNMVDLIKKEAATYEGAKT